MPVLYYRVDAPGVNILKSVQDKVIDGFLLELGLTNSFKDALYVNSSFTAVSNYSDPDGKPMLLRNRCDVEVSYVMDKTQVPWPVDTPYTTPAYGIRTSNKGHHTPVLLDQQAGILIEHYTSACAIKMNFTMTFETFDEATSAFDTIKNRYQGSLIQIPYDLSFSYPVSFGLLEFLVSVYKAKTDYASKSFIDYINDMKVTEIGFDIRKTQLLDPTPDKELLVRCQQLNCLAQLTMDQEEPEPNRIQELAGTYSLSFTLTVQFGRPTLIAVNTPVSVDNTVLPSLLFENTITNYHYNPGVGGIYQDIALNGFAKANYGDYSKSAQIVRLPAYDDWFTVDSQYAFYKYRPFLIAHFTLDGATTTFNLKDLDVSLHPITQDIISQTGNSIFGYGGLFTIGVYAGSLRLGPNLVSIDSDLNITVTSSRPDQVYHLMISETTRLEKTNSFWDQILLKYRYFFPLTIERNLQSLVSKRFFYIANDNETLSLITKLGRMNKIKPLLDQMIALGETTADIYAYTQTATQLADYLSYTQSMRTNYVLPTGTDPISVIVNIYYTTKASVTGRSLYVAFIEQCLINGYLTLDTIPTQYIEPSATSYPYYLGNGGYYGFNTPLRVIQYTTQPNQHP